jgi:hypothetical protein
MVASGGMATLLALAMAGCGAASSLPSGGSEGGGSAGAAPLGGVWSATVSENGDLIVSTVTLAGDGTGTSSISFGSIGGAQCTGSVTYSGVAWTATANTITMSSGTCSGQVSCGSGTTIQCTDITSVAATCDYTLSNGDDTLVLTCPGDATTYTRQG